MFDIMPGSSFSLPGSTEVAFMFSKKRDLENFATENVSSLIKIIILKLLL